MNRVSDYDVLVVGGGPSGVAAAVRVRWLKRYLMVPCKVAIIDPASLGGLTQMGTTHFIGPGWLYSSEGINPLLSTDVENFRIPHIRERVVAVQKHERFFQVELSDNRTLTARAVILCTGMKLLSRENEFWQRGVLATSLGIQASVQKIRKWLADPRHRRIVFCGTERMSNLMPLVASYARNDHQVQYVIEPTCGHPVRSDYRQCSNVTRGTVIALDGKERLVRATVETNPGKTRDLNDIDLLVIDFISYELSPARCFETPGLALGDNGFIDVDRQQHTNIEGLFAAGDATGMPAAVVTALGEGVVAGFSAYRYVYAQKFGVEPPLFAYYGVDRELNEQFQELPHCDAASFSLEPLSDSEVMLRHARRCLGNGASGKAAALIDALGKDSRCTIEMLAKQTEIPLKRLQEVIHSLLQHKCVTLQPVRTDDAIL